MTGVDGSAQGAFACCRVKYNGGYDAQSLLHIRYRRNAG